MTGETRGADEWSTPPALYKALDRYFAFTLDAAASDANHKHARYFTKEDSALRKTWAGERVFINPPYSKKTKTNPGIEGWVKHAIIESTTHSHTHIAMLLPADTSTLYFSLCFERASEIWFLTPRVKFGGGSGSPPWGNMIVVFNGRRMGESATFARWLWQEDRFL